MRIDRPDPITLSIKRCSAVAPSPSVSPVLPAFMCSSWFARRTPPTRLRWTWLRVSNLDTSMNSNTKLRVMTFGHTRAMIQKPADQTLEASSTTCLSLRATRIIIHLTTILRAWVLKWNSLSRKCECSRVRWKRSAMDTITSSTQWRIRGCACRPTPTNRQIQRAIDTSLALFSVVGDNRRIAQTVTLTNLRSSTPLRSRKRHITKDYSRLVENRAHSLRPSLTIIRSNWELTHW